MPAWSSLRSDPGSSSQDGGVPPPNADALYEILLRVPAKDLGRCHAVCRPWRCILTDPHFVDAHKARHDPLIVVGYSTYSQSTLCDIMDLSGRVLKQVHVTGCWRATSVHLDFICASSSRSFRLLNLSSGAVYILPDELTEEHAAEEQNTSRFYVDAAFGQAKSTGQHKVLRVLDRHSNDGQGQLFEIFTLGGGSHGRWRAKEAPPYFVLVGMWKTAVFINGIFYFFCVEPVVRAGDVAIDRVASFDLETEEWRPTLRGPLSSSVDYVPGQPFPRFDTVDLSMCDINGCLVVVHRTLSSLVELWFLVDFERGLWVKKHIMRVQFRDPYSVAYTVRLLVVLWDGRIVFVQVGDEKGSLRIYDPRTNTYSDVAEMGNCFAVGLYTRGLLGLADGASQ
ncbi:hypothetical protein EJB05_25176, partial [Eragrostis curvula]